MPTGTLTHDELGDAAGADARLDAGTEASREVRPKIERERCEDREHDRGAKGHEQAEGAGEIGGMGHTGRWYKARTSR